MHDTSPKQHGGLSGLPKATGVVARLAYAKVAAAGIDPDPLLKKAGLTLQQIDNRQARVGASSQVKFLTLAAEVLNDDFLGISLALDFDLRELGLLNYVVTSSATVGEALQRAARYCSIANEGITLAYREGNDVTLTLGYVGIARQSDQHQMEGLATMLVRVCRQLSGTGVTPASVTFMHHRSGLPPPQKKLLGHGVTFGAPADRLTYPKSLASMPVQGADPYLNRMLVSYCEEALAHRAASRGAVGVDVENTIIPLLPHGQAKVGEVCRRLGMSNRTLSRRLLSEQLTFARVLDNLRHDLALRYLNDDDLSVSTIAWLLGYQEVSSFTHAFKRWTGKTPKQARQEGVPPA